MKYNKLSRLKHTGTRQGAQDLIPAQTGSLSAG